MIMVTFFVGDTPVNYSISSGTTTTIVDFTFFSGDGFWDVPGGIGKEDGIGPNHEWAGCTPYGFYPRVYTVSFPNPENMGWKDEEKK